MKILLTDNQQEQWNLTGCTITTSNSTVWDSPIRNNGCTGLRAAVPLCSAADSLPHPWLPADLHSDAACAVVQTLGRFMASYFTNQPLYIRPPHHVAFLPPLHLPHGVCPWLSHFKGSMYYLYLYFITSFFTARGVGRLVPLCQEEVSKAVRQQHLSEVWTVDYAQDLLLLGGLLPETVWLARHLGDWKAAATLSLAYTNHCTDRFDFTQLRRRELHLPADLEPQSIFQVELQCLLGNTLDSQEVREKEGHMSFTGWWSLEPEWPRPRDSFRDVNGYLNLCN